MKKLLIVLILINLNSIKAQTFSDFFGIDSNEVLYQIWLRKYSNSFDSVIKFHSIQQRDDLKAYEDSLDIYVYLENSKLTVFVKEELIVSILWKKDQLIVNDRGLIYEFKHRHKAIKWIKILDQEKEAKVRFKDGKLTTKSESFEFDKKYLGEEFLNRMEKKFNLYFIEIKV